MGKRSADGLVFVPPTLFQLNFNPRRCRLCLRPADFSTFILSAFFCVAFGFAPKASAQQTLGGITGVVEDSSGGIVPNATVSLLGDQTQLSRTQTTSDSGSYTFVNLPIGTYTLTFSHDSFKTQKVPSILVQANRTVTVNASLEVGEVSTTVTVEETPLSERRGHDQRLRAG